MPSWSVDFLATAPPEEYSSGLSRSVWELASHLASRGHRTRVLYPESERVADRTLYPGVDRVVVPLVGVSRRPFGRDIAIGRNASALLGPETDVVVGNDEKAGALALPRGSRPGRPVFVYFVMDIALHTFDTLRPLEPRRGVRQRLGNFVDRRALTRLEGTAIARAHKVVVPSELNRTLLDRYYRVASERIVSIPLGVPDPVLVGSRGECRGALRIPLDVPVVAFIGRTPNRQGLGLALDAFRRVRSLFPGARFVVVGSSVPAEPGIISLGEVDETVKAQVLRSADVFLHPAVYEGYGLAPREAMRYGVATVVSAHVPMDGIDEKVAIRRVTTDDAEEYARELAELLADPALRRTMGEAGKLWADGFSFDAMAVRFEQMVDPLLGGAA